MASARTTSYWQVFRLIFVIFSLYLMGDAFFRWDGFRYYASFSEFIPSIALITILWSIVAVFTAMLVWLSGRVVEWLSQRIGWRIKMEHWLLFICAFILFGVAVWIFRRRIWNIVHMHREVLFLCVTFAVILLTWLSRNKSERWISVIQERITPLVWLFGIWVVFSIPVVAYHTWIKQTDNTVSQRIPGTTTDDRSRPNIILVTFDALTARDMSVYGYERPTTPFISGWAKSASLFRRLEAAGNITTPTTASLMTGKRLWTHQAYHQIGSKPEKSSIENLPLVLKNNGYYTMAFVVNRRASVKTLGISNSFDVAPIGTEFRMPVSLLGIVYKSLYRLFGDKIRLHDWIIKGDFILCRFVDIMSRHSTKTTVPPENAFNRFLWIIDNNPGEPFFVWIHLLPPHDPYLPPAPYIGMFDSSSELRTFKSQWKELKTLKNLWRRFKPQDFPQEIQATFDTLRSRYDEFIRYCDKQFEDFINGLKKRDILKNTVIIMSSDHGESFEHNYLGHGRKYLYEQVTHIPLIIKEPDQTEGQIINDLIEQIDIPATILELANIAVPTWMEGRSLAPLMRGKRLSSKPLFSMNFQKNKSRGQKIINGSIAVWEGDYKLIHYIEEKESLLFNLKQDPDELNNLFDKEPEAGQRLLSLIQDNLKKANERISKGE